MSSEEAGQMRREIMKQREIDEIRRLGLPYLRAGMSHNAATVELRRAVRRMEVRDRLLKAWQEERRALQQPQPETDDPAESVARALLGALNSGGREKQHAEQYLKTAHPRVKEKLRELADVDSEFKTRRSRKPNGF